jgi:hypothetical protein
MLTLDRKRPAPSVRSPLQMPESRDQTLAPTNPLWSRSASSRGVRATARHGAQLDFARIAITRPPILRKPAVSSPGDPYERDADDAADKVMRMVDPAPIGAAPAVVQRRCATCEGEEESVIQRERAPSLQPGAELDVEAAVRAARRGGEPLPGALRSYFEPRFGHDLGNVRVHAGGEAADAARAVQARAYTVGGDIVFGAGQYAPGTEAGKRLLAHELAHVVQQRAAPAGSAGLLQRQPAEGASPGCGPRFKRRFRGKINAEQPESHRGVPRMYYATTQQDEKVPGRPVEPLIAGTELDAGETGGYGGLWRSVCSRTSTLPVQILWVLDEYVSNLDAQRTREAEAAAEAGAVQAPDTSNEPAEGADLLARPASAILKDSSYIDNRMKSVSFYAGELAVIDYEDGSQLRVGLVPEYIKAPIEGVDYRTPRSDHILVSSSERGKMGYIPRGREALLHVPDRMTAGEAIEALNRTVTFKRDPASKRIVPTQINDLTAPRLCQALREAEAEFVRDFDAFASGGEKISKKAELILHIASLLPGGGGLVKKLEARAASKAAEKAGESLVTRLAKRLADALKRDGVIAEILEDGVYLGKIKVSRTGSTLTVAYAGIKKISDVRHQGKIMQIALEGAAVQVAKEAGLKEAHVMVQLVVNPTWAAYLESIGYTRTVVEKVGSVGVEAVYLKVLKVIE